jgi:hypothetical protein
MSHVGLNFSFGHFSCNFFKIKGCKEGKNLDVDDFNLMQFSIGFGV